MLIGNSLFRKGGEERKGGIWGVKGALEQWRFLSIALLEKWRNATWMGTNGRERGSADRGDFCGGTPGRRSWNNSDQRGPGRRKE